MQDINRSEYVKNCRELASELIFKEKLPLVGDILQFATDDKASPKLQKVFDYFGDEDEMRDLVTRKSVQFTAEESSTFIASVIAANVTDISESGSIYKKLQATGDTYRIRGRDCGSVGKRIELPISEEDFLYSIRNSNFTTEKGSKDYKMYYDYQLFCKDMSESGVSEIWVRTPMTCRQHTKHGCCPICAGDLPEGVQNIGAFSTLMITEIATQAALSSMNKGRKVNVNFLLTQNGSEVTTLKDFYKWCDKILDELKGASVERRYYEIALLGRLHYDSKKKSVTVASLANPNSDNYLGEFIYRPREVSYRKMISAGLFNDDSLKAQIALNNYRKEYF